MEKTLNQLSLGMRIMALSLIPLFVAFIFAVSVALKSKQSMDEAGAINTLAEYSPTVSALVHELQKERGRTAGFIASGGTTERKRQVTTQRSATDGALRSLAQINQSFDHAAFGSDFESLIRAYQMELNRLSNIRTSIDNMNMTVPQMAAYYTGTIAHLLDAVKIMAQLSEDANVSRSITAYVSVLEAKERAGLERAMGNGGYAAGAFAPNIYKRFIELIAVQKSYISTFEHYASSDGLSFYRRTVQGPAVDRVQQMRDHAFATQGNVGTDRFTSTQWFDQITAKIDLFKRVEDYLNQEIVNTTASHYESASFQFWALLIALIVGVVAIVGFSYAVFRSVSAPLSMLEGVMEKLAKGDIDTDVPYTDYGSSIGQMAKAVFAFKEGSQERIVLEAEAAAGEERRRQDEEEARIEEERLQEEKRQREEARVAAREQNAAQLEELIANFIQGVQHSLSGLSTAAHSLESTSESMVGQAQENETETNAAATSAEQTSSNVQTVASATEELTASIGEISRQVAESASISQNAVVETENAAKIVTDLNSSSEKVGEVVKLINDIAEQTNLLALNATIEAARAGEAGKGFAVVASEVKALANQTASATSEIANHVGNIQTVSQDVSTVVQTIRSVIERTNNISAAVAAAVEEQGAATSEISRNIQEANHGTQEVTSRIQSVQRVAEETRNSSTSVKESSETVGVQSGELNNMISQFVEDVQQLQNQARMEQAAE